MAEWFYQDKAIKSISDLPSDAVGFVYKITNLSNGRIYIGRKILHNRLTKPLTKKEASEWQKPGRVPKKKKVIKESNWQEYWGSSSPLKDDVARLGEGAFKREMLVICKTKKQLSYYEVYWQVKLDVLATDAYNDNIAGKFYRKDLLL